MSSSESDDDDDRYRRKRKAKKKEKREKKENEKKKRREPGIGILRYLCLIVFASSFSTVLMLLNMHLSCGLKKL